MNGKRPTAKTSPVVDDNMRPKYDFTDGAHGKHYKVLREEGYIVRIYNDDSTVTVASQVIVGKEGLI